MRRRFGRSASRPPLRLRSWEQSVFLQTVARRFKSSFFHHGDTEDAEVHGEPNSSVNLRVLRVSVVKTVFDFFLAQYLPELRAGSCRYISQKRCY